MAMNLALPSERFKGFRPDHRRRKAFLLVIGVSYPICRTRRSGIFSILCGARGPFTGSAGHGNVGAVGCWPLVVGAYANTNPTYD